MKISIITICYQPGLVILSAIESVLGQSYDDVEYIIVDGGSKDGSVECIIRRLASSESGEAVLPNIEALSLNLDVGGKTIRLVSEKDNGLYDALNKGILLATGDVIGFVHADDFLAHENVLKNVAECFFKNDTEGVYGDLQYVRDCGLPTKDTEPHKEEQSGDRQSIEDDGQPTFEKSNFSVVRHWESGSYRREKLKWGWMPPHPSLYLKREVYERAELENGEFFDTSFTCAADYDFMMRILSQLDVIPEYVPEVLIKMRVGGVSNRSVKHMLRKSAEDWRAIRRNRIGHIHTLAWKNLQKIGQFFRH
ncbi:glycosyltransferase [Puniceicoccaceae bacterium K14]|nr:glycosyltransferase [Puniceicoccaceae bacterium K14]